MCSGRQGKSRSQDMEGPGIEDELLFGKNMFQFQKVVAVRIGYQELQTTLLKIPSFKGGKGAGHEINVCLLP